MRSFVDSQPQSSLTAKSVRQTKTTAPRRFIPALLLLSTLTALPTLPALGAPMEKVGTSSASSDLMSPSTRPMFAVLTLGGAIGVNRNSANQGKFGQEFGWHMLSGDGTGLAVGAALQESFGNSVFIFRAGAKAWWDFKLIPALPNLTIAPFAQLGFAVLAVSTPFGSDSSGAFNWQFGAEARIVFKNRWMVLFRPFALDFLHNNGTSVSYDMQVGGGMTF